MLYKDETLQGMIEVKNKSKTISKEDSQRLLSMQRDKKENRYDIVQVTNKIISFYEKDNTQLLTKNNRTPEEEEIIQENKEYITNYQSLIKAMN